MAGLIPTEIREPLAKELAYPVGAEAISIALEGAEHFGSLSLWFGPGLTAAPAWFRDRVRRGEFLPVLEGSWQRDERGHSASRDLLERGYYEARWELRVFAVPREFKSTARRALRESGFARLRQWLRRETPPEHERGRRRLLVSVRLLDGEVEAEESRGWG